MTEAASRKSGLKWPVCTIIILAALGGLGWWGYAKFQGERALPRIEAQAKAPGQAKAPLGAARTQAAYRTVFPTYFLVGFSILMAAILGTIIYLWWSLKDLEGGKRYGEEDAENMPEEKNASAS